MEFSYQARDNQGILRTGTVEAASEEAATDVLQNHGLIIIKIYPVGKIDILSKINIFARISPKELVLFSRQFSTLIEAKVPIVQALRILQLQVTNHSFQKVISDIAEKVEAGDSLSVAVSNFPDVFSGLYVNLVRSGELSGTLDKSLVYLADQLEKDCDLRSKVVGALTYPAFIIGALVLVGVLMFVYVLPPLVGVLSEAQVELPITTRILIAATNFMQNFWWVVILLVLGGGVAFRIYSRSLGGRYMVDHGKIIIPIFGKMWQKIYMVRFARNLATLIAGGIPIVKALDSVADIIGNTVYRDIVLDASQQVRNGKGIASALVDRDEFPPLVSQMTQIGESTGKLQEVLEKMASFYEKEVEATLKTITTLIEPIIMILIGCAVAIMVAGILLPIYNLASAV